MLQYNFLNFSPTEFEDLVRDLIQKKEDIVLESFSEGKDGGIDFRYAPAKNKTLVVQAKRYNTYPALVRVLKKEILTAKKLKTSRYILATSITLTPARKKEILRLFKNVIRKPGDLLGREDLNNLLGLHPEVETCHFKLWLSSTNVLQRILNSRIYNQSSFEENEVRETIKYYVRNDSFDHALKIIKKHRFVIVSGIPGIGKTTLGRILSYYFLSNNYEEFIYLSAAIDDGDEVYSEKKKQVFLFDDFLGKSALKAMSGNEEQRLVKFIERVTKSKNKVLIITTREYVLNQAKTRYEDIERSRIDFAKCILDLSFYSNLIRAKILYNHLYFSDLPRAYINNILQEEGYLEIIRHANYNPRTIGTIIRKKQVWSSIKPAQFFETFMGYLNNPGEIWRHVYENQVSELSRMILVQLCLTDMEVFYDLLELRVKAFFKNRPGAVFTKITFDNALKELENTFIFIDSRYSDEPLIALQNASIRDFLSDYINKDRALIHDIIEAAVDLFQIIEFHSKENTRSEHSVKTVFLDSNEYVIWRKKLLQLVDEELCNTRHAEYILESLERLLNYINIYDDETTSRFVYSNLKLIDIRTLKYYELERYVEIFSDLHYQVCSDRDWRAIFSAIAARADSFDDLYTLLEFIEDEQDRFIIFLDTKAGTSFLKKADKMILQEIKEFSKQDVIKSDSLEYMTEAIELFDYILAYTVDYTQLLRDAIKDKPIVDATNDEQPFKASDPEVDTEAIKDIFKTL